jgi:excisionase family DNA binding protein
MPIKLIETTIGIQAAADHLTMSKAGLMRLLENGQVPFSKVGTHPRIKVSDLITHEKRKKATRKRHLKFLAKQGQELNLGYSND